MTQVKRVVFLDRRGRKYTAEIPADVPDIEAYRGALVGPPDVADVLELPEPIATRVHNALHDRAVFTPADAKRPGVVFGALQAALKVDQFAIVSAFEHAEADPEMEEDGEVEDVTEEKPAKPAKKPKTAPESEADPVP